MSKLEQNSLCADYKTKCSLPLDFDMDTNKYKS